MGWLTSFHLNFKSLEIHLTYLFPIRPGPPKKKKFSAEKLLFSVGPDAAVQGQPLQVSLHAYTILGKLDEAGSDLDAAAPAALLPAQLEFTTVPLIESLGESACLPPACCDHQPHPSLSCPVPC